MIANLLDNSISFTEKGGKIIVNISITSNKKLQLKLLMKVKDLKKKILLKYLGDFIAIDQINLENILVLD